MEEVYDLLYMAQQNPDTETAHAVADAVLCNVLDKIGYKKLVREYRKVGKKYA